MKTDYTAEVAAGADWLDAHHPDWLAAFAADAGAGLQMSDCSRCVLGYVLGSYFSERGPLPYPGVLSPEKFIDQVMAEAEANVAVAAPLGFTTPVLYDDDPGHAYNDAEIDAVETVQWEALGAAWLDLLGKRLAEAGLLGAGA